MAHSDITYKEVVRYLLEELEIEVYKSNLDKVELPETAQALLERYSEERSLEFREALEELYPTEVVKEVAYKQGKLSQHLNSFRGKLQMILEMRGFHWLITKKTLTIFLVLVMAICLYNTFLRYEYKTIKDARYDRLQVTKIDRLTGKASFFYPEFQKEK